MVSIGKINVGRRDRRERFDLTHDVNTTSDFGFCQPTLIRMFNRGTKISLKSDTFVRLAPMPVPTFGRIACKQHTAFVPMNDVFEAFDFFQANKSVTSALRSYIPTSTDYCKNLFILRSLFDIVFDSHSFLNTFSMDYSKLPFRLSLQFKDSDGVYRDYLNDDKYITDLDTMRSHVEFLRTMAFKKDSSGNASFGTVSYYLDYVFSSNSENILALGDGEVPLGHINTSDGSIRTEASFPYIRVFGTYKPNRAEPLMTDDFSIPGVGDYNELIGLRGPAEFVSNNFFLDEMSVENADYVFDFSKFSAEAGSLNNFKLCVHLTPNGRRIMKVLTSCGITFGYSDVKFSLPELFSYYKVWFDKYNPGRNLQWRDTNCYGLIHSYYDSGFTTENLVLRNSTSVDTSIPNLSDLYASSSLYAKVTVFWYGFLLDLPLCCYSLPLDNVTVALESPVLDNALSESGFDYEGSSLGDGSIMHLPVTRDSNMTVYNSVSSNSPYGNPENVNGLSVKLLSRIYHLVNKNSVIGSKIDDYLKAHGISNGLPESTVLGDTTFACSLDDVFSTVNNSDTYLGEYAGRGIGSGSSDYMNFETKTFGYLIQLTCIVPFGGYVQGNKLSPVSRYDFYQSEFDSLGMEVMPLSSVLGRRYDILPNHNDKVFGFVPRYFQMKIQNNLANGGFAQRSQMSSFLPYSLDRIFSTEINEYFGTKEVNLVPDEELRFIGRSEIFGNYDRIFYDTSGTTDNFIIHMVQELSMYANMKAVSNSFDAFDDDVDNDSVNLEHS